MNFGAAARTAVGLVAGLAGGALFSTLGIPLPCMLGSLKAAAIIAVAVGVNFSLNEFFRTLARPVIGVFAGSAFTLAIALSILESWPIILFLAAYFVLFTLLGTVFFRRICGLDKATAYFASTPGGLGELTLLGGLYGGSTRSLVIIHTIRIITVVCVIPFAVQLLEPGHAPLSGMPSIGHRGALSLLDWLLLAACGVVGYAIARAVNMASGSMLIPMALSAGIHVAGLTEGAPPGWLVAFVQVVIGSVSGARFAGLLWKEFRTTVVLGLVWAIIMLVGAFLMALVSSTVVEAPLAALLLAFAPGGFAEITIVAFAIQIEVAFVVTCHVFRSFFVLVFAPLGFRLVAGKPPPPPASPV